MMYRVVILIAFLLTCVGCAKEPSQDTSTDANVANTSDGAYDQTAIYKISSDRQSPRVGGTYYRGDHLGFNQDLILSADGTFECEWSGCLGVYGNTAGTWTQEDNRIAVNITSVEGMFEKNPIGDLELIDIDGKTVLLQLNDREFFDKWGPSRYSAFSKRD